MNVVFIVKSQTNGMKVVLYDKDLCRLESETFSDLYTLNFHLQTLAKKYNISKGLMIVHDTDNNKVDLALSNGDDSFFID